MTAEGTPARDRIVAERAAAAAEHDLPGPGVYTLDSAEGQAFLGFLTREPSLLERFMRECGDACDETYDEAIGGCGGCACHISAPCGHCLRRSDEAETEGLL